MLQLHPGQMKILDDGSRRDFLEKLESALRSRHPELVGTMPGEVLLSHLTASLTAAKRYGIVFETHVYQFSVLFLALGRDFEQRPETRWAVDLLLTDLPPETRLFQVREVYLEREEG